MQIVGFGLTVAMGVVEEKSSRVVELLLSTIRPLDLLWGKVLGIGAVGLVQLLAYGVVGIVTGLATGLLTITGTAVGVFGAALLAGSCSATPSSPSSTPPPGRWCRARRTSAPRPGR
ncbi:ABC transporter permease [Pseudonocardia sp. ICBG1293]|uniref:ABC transporter permease n=1 Tax=Pseudonocardia sp. ICBG1293 TaxID=2844382 RepID=UPI0021055D0B|nr:ABC transporter permease [Pseudonocardia sp. ICBG1293]